MSRATRAGWASVQEMADKPFHSFLDDIAHPASIFRQQ